VYSVTILISKFIVEKWMNGWYIQYDL